MATERKADFFQALTESTKGKPKDEDQPLTEKQRNFVHYFVDQQMTQTAAARLAGYTSNPGSAALELMKNEKIQKAIAQQRILYQQASQMTKKKVIDGFAEAIDMARSKGDPLTMIAGWREIGKMCGLYEATKSKIDISVNGQVLIQKLQSMPDGELLALLEEDSGALPLDGEFEVLDDGNEPPA